MADDATRLDLIQRLAEKQARSDSRPLAERAAERMAATAVPKGGPSPNGPSQPAKTRTGKRSAPGQTTAKPAKTEPVKKETAPPEKGRAARSVVAISERLRQRGYVAPGASQTHMAEEFRTIKRPLLLRAFGDSRRKIERGNVILVTSARPGEGKTFIAVNLAMSIASERDLHVLLIDSDVYRHTLQEEMGIGESKGLVDLLLNDDLNLPDLLLRTDIPNLTILPVGRRHPQAPELLSSQKMATLMGDIAARYPDRVIIIDSPPVLASSEASVLAMLVGQVVLVVEANGTSGENVEQALALISTCENINFVINKTDGASGSAPYGTYAYYDEYRKDK